MNTMTIKTTVVLFVLFAATTASCQTIDIQNSNKPEYEIDYSGAYDTRAVYKDRNYIILGMPDEMKGGVLIKTLQSDRESTGAAGFFTFDVNVPSHVFVLLDRTRDRRIPAWLNPDSGWINTEAFLSVIHYRAGDNFKPLNYLILRKTLTEPGTVELGANNSQDYFGRAMYFVVVVPI
jgi:hypothetical protein